MATRNGLTYAVWGLAALAAMALGINVAGAQSASPTLDRMLLPTIAELTEVLQEIGYTVTTEGDVIKAKHDSKPNFIISINREDILLASAWRIQPSVDRARVLEACNQCNIQAKRGRYYIARDGVLIVDRCLDTRGGLTCRSFRQAVELRGQEMLVLLGRNMQDMVQ